MADHAVVDEEFSARKPGRFTRLKAYFIQDITESWADAVLILSCFIAGLIDSAVFNVWSCFVSMQTGNTVYVGLGVSGQPASQPYRWVKSLTAILCFSIGTFFFSRLSRFIGPLRRDTMVLSFTLQTLLCLAAAAMVTGGIVSNSAGSELPHNLIVLIPLGMLSFQSGGQIVMSRLLAYNELPTVVLTSTYCDLMMDPLLLTAPLREDVKRNRRALSVLLLVLGAMVGGFLTKDGRSIATALWLAGGLKALIAIQWVFWRSKEGNIRL